MTKTPLSVKVLQQVLDVHNWTQNDLADHTHIHRATISHHLSRQRPIRDDHLVSYLGALDRIARPMLLAAWLRDTLPTDLIQDLFPKPPASARETDTEPQYGFKSEIVSWSPQLDDEQRDMLQWWADKLVRDPELDEIFRSITRKAGYIPPSKSV